MYLADGLSLIYNTSAELNVVEQYDTVALDGGNVLNYIVNKIWSISGIFYTWLDNECKIGE